MKKIAFKKTLLSTSLFAVLSAVSTSGFASAFQIWEQNGAGTGDYHAGGAAEAEDASTTYYNPAGLTRLKHPQVVLSGVAVPTDLKFTGTVNQVGIESNTGSAQGGGFSWKNNFAPAGYFAVPVSDHVTFGFGMAVPFGLVTDYPADSIAAPFSTTTSMKVINLTPSVGIQLTNQLSVGVGFDANHMDAEFDNFFFDSFADTNKGSAWGYGWHAGALYQFTPATRLGLSYHSQVRYHLKGKSTLDTLEDNNLKSNVTLPAYTMLSFYHDFNPRWTVLATAIYTQWNVFKNITLQNVAGSDNPITLPQNFKNSWNIALGAHYHINPKWMLKVGGGYDRTPTNNTDRNLRLPDASRYALAAGVHYQPIKSLGLDFGWSHIFFQNAHINNDSDIGLEQIITTGTTKGYANVIGMQMTWTFL